MQGDRKSTEKKDLISGQPLEIMQLTRWIFTFFVTSSSVTVDAWKQFQLTSGI